jgi:hypothetical protein
MACLPLVLLARLINYINIKSAGQRVAGIQLNMRD